MCDNKDAMDHTYTPLAALTVKKQQHGQQLAAWNYLIQSLEVCALWLHEGLDISRCHMMSMIKLQMTM